jgi:Kinesin motor domain
MTSQLRCRFFSLAIIVWIIVICCFVYSVKILLDSGQTGSGKTFTMLGPHEEAGCFQHELRGVIPRSFDYLFKLLQKDQEVVSLSLT